MFSMQQFGRQLVSRSAPRSCLTGGGPKKIRPQNPGAAASLSSLSCPFETYAATAPVHDEADWRLRTKKFTHAALMAQEANSSTLPQEKMPATAADDDTASSWRVRSLRFTYPALMAEASIPETASAAPRERPLQAAGLARFDHEKTAAADWRVRSSKFTHAALTMAEQASSTLPQETPAAADAASSWRVRSLKFTYPALMMAETANTRPETTMTSAAAPPQELPLQAAGQNARVDHEKTAAADWRVRTRKSTHAALTMAEQANSTLPQETPADDDAASSWRVRSLKFTHPALMAEATFEENQRAAGSLEEPSFLIHQEAAEQILLLIGEEEGDLARQ